MIRGKRLKADSSAAHTGILRAGTAHFSAGRGKVSGEQIDFAEARYELLKKGAA